MALRDVNLLPGPLLQQRYIKRHGIGWLVGFAVVLTALLVRHITFSTAMSARVQPGLTQREIAVQRADTIAKIEVRKEELSRLAFVQKVYSPVGPDQILNHLAKSMPADTWLMRLTVNAGSSSESELRLEGYARSNASLGAMIDGLSKSPAFKEVNLGGSTDVRPDRDNPDEVESLVRFDATVTAVTQPTP